MRKHLILVPGILGSGLRYVGEGPFGRSVDSPVWDENFSTLLDTLAVDPRRLGRRLQVGSILREIRWLKMSWPLYGPLIDRLATYGYEAATQTATLFPYDWRQDNFETARALSDRLNDLVRAGTTRITILAHSMGCLVARLAVRSVQDANRELALRIVQIAPPIRGSAYAFYNLKVMPDIHDVFTWYLRIRDVFSGKRYRWLMDAIKQFESVYQLLPPQTEHILINSKGHQYSALDERVWSEAQLSAVKKAQQIHVSACDIDNTEIVSLYSSHRHTDSLYVVDEYFDFVRRVKTQTNGDGRVTIDSAIEHTVDSNRHPLRSGVDHHLLPSCPELLDKLETVL